MNVTKEIHIYQGTLPSLLFCFAQSLTQKSWNVNVEKAETYLFLTHAYQRTTLFLAWLSPAFINIVLDWDACLKSKRYHVHRYHYK